MPDYVSTPQSAKNKKKNKKIKNKKNKSNKKKRERKRRNKKKQKETKKKEDKNLKEEGKESAEYYTKKPTKNACPRAPLECLTSETNTNMTSARRFTVTAKHTGR